MTELQRKAHFSECHVLLSPHRYISGLGLHYNAKLTHKHVTHIPLMTTSNAGQSEDKNAIDLLTCSRGNHTPGSHCNSLVALAKSYSLFQITHISREDYAQSIELAKLMAAKGQTINYYSTHNFA